MAKFAISIFGEAAVDSLDGNGINHSAHFEAALLELHDARVVDARSLREN